MSNYVQITKHPITGIYEKAEYCDDYFGPHVYGVKFPSDEKVWPLQLVDEAQICTFWVDDILLALQYCEGFGWNDEKKLLFLNQVQKQYQARWHRDPIGGEGAMKYFEDHLI